MNDLTDAQKGRIGGQKRGIKHSKPTKGEMRKRIRLVRVMLANCYGDAEIRRTVADRYKCSQDTVIRYLQRARKELLEETGRPVEEHIAEAYEVYGSILRSQNATLSERLKAQQAKCKLLGLNKPEKIAQTDGEGLDLYPQDMSKATVLEIDKLMEKNRRRAALN